MGVPPPMKTVRGMRSAEVDQMQVDFAGQCVKIRFGLIKMAGHGIKVAIVTLGGTKRDVEVKGVDLVGLVGEGCGQRVERGLRQWSGGGHHTHCSKGTMPASERTA